MADVAGTLPLWSTNEASNLPAGTTTIGSGLDDNLRQIQAIVRAWISSRGANIVAAATTDLGAIAGSAHDITGNGTIVGFGTVSAGIWKWLRFTGTPLLKNNATSMILQGGADIQAATGDGCYAESLGSGNWLVPSFQKADGTAPIFITGLTEVTAVATGDYLPLWDVSASANRKATVANVRDAMIPAGIIMDFGGTVAPSGWLPCDGTSVSSATYANLYAAIGTAWGGNGSPLFNVPDFRRRVSVGSGGSGTATLAATVGSTGGEETHTQSLGELAAHTHGLIGAGNSGLAASHIAMTPNTGTTIPTESAGSSTPFNVMQPSAVVLKIIKY